MSNTPTIEEVMKRVSELEEQLATLNKAISTQAMTVSGDATVKGSFVAGSITEGGSALAEKYQAKGEYQPKGDYQPKGNYQPAGTYQPVGNYLRSSGAASIQHGTEHMPAGVGIVKVDFPSAFRSPPIVLVSEVEGSAGFTALLASGITKQGFNAVKKMNDQSTCAVHWIAIGS